LGSTNSPSLDGSITLADKAAVGTDGEFNFTLSTSKDEPSTDIIFLEIPVVAIDAEIPGIITWKIRGGLDNALPDFDGGNSGGIVISVAYNPATPSVTVGIGADGL
jgi:hypothetical protein